MSQRIAKDSFVRPSCDIKLLISILESHRGLFVINDVVYDAILYCGTDNLYFSYCFSYTTGRAVAETLLIVDNITKVSDRSYSVKSGNLETLVFLKE